MSGIRVPLIDVYFRLLRVQPPFFYVLRCLATVFSDNLNRLFHGLFLLSLINLGKIALYPLGGIAVSA